MRSEEEVSYELVKRFVLVPELSNISADAKVIIPNIPYFSGAARVQQEEDLLTLWGFQVI